ncbi:MAG: Ig-like domain-containing protein [Hominisplanchenecus sp.]|nr:Ig-like domain-containing protein [Hominisplanchenecus sp.]
MKVAEGDVEGLQINTFPGEEEEVLIWLSGGELFEMRGLDEKPENRFSDMQTLISGEYQIHGSSIYFLAGGGEGSDIYRMTRKEDGSFTTPVALSNQEAYLGNLQIMTLDGQECAVVQKTQLDAGTGEMKDSLGWIWLDDVRDLVLVGTDFSDEQVLAEEPLPVTLTVWNKGSRTVSGIRYEVKNSRREIVANGVKTAGLEPGEEEKIEIEIPRGENPGNEAYAIEIWEEDEGNVYEETNKGDNQTQIFVSSADLALEVEQSMEGKEVQLTVLVENQGKEPAGGQVILSNEENVSDHPMRIDLPELEPGQREAFQILLKDDFFENPGEEEAITVEVISDVQDIALQNNRETILVQQNCRIVYSEHGNQTIVDYYRKGETLILPAPSDRKRFLGWYSRNADGTEYMLQEGTLVSGDMEIYAKYETQEETHHFADFYTVDKQATLWEEGIRSRHCMDAGCTAKTDVQAIAKLKPIISLNVKSLPLKVNQSTKAVKVTKMTEGDSIVSWKSSNPKIISVSKNGTIKGRRVGKARVTVTLKSNLSASVVIQVQKKPVTTSKITVSAKSLKLKVRQKKKLETAVTPLTSSQKVTYQTSDKKIVTVTKKGVIRGRKAGKAKITVRSGKKKVVVKVTVTKG